MGVEHIPRASNECLNECEVLNGSNVVDIRSKEGEQGWVILQGSNGHASEPLVDLGNNTPYFSVVRECIGRGACEQCILYPYTKKAYIERGEFSEIA